MLSENEAEPANDCEIEHDMHIDESVTQIQDYVAKNLQVRYFASCFSLVHFVTIVVTPAHATAARYHAGGSRANVC
jgi:hypothetical protein